MSLPASAPGRVRVDGLSIHLAAAATPSRPCSP